MLRVFILCAENVLTHDEDISDAYCTVTYEGRSQTRANEEGYYIKYVVESFLRLALSFLYNHNHSLSLPCCQSSYIRHSIKRAIIGKAVAVSLSLSRVCLWVSCCTWNMCV